MLDAPLCLSAPPHRVQPLDELDDASAEEVQQAATYLSSAAEQIETSLFTPRSIHRQLHRVRTQINQIKIRLLKHGVRLTPPTAQGSRATLERTLDHAALHLKADADLRTAVHCCSRFDEYFGTRRIDEMDARHFLLQFLVTTDFVLRDLPFCMLDRHEVVMILRGAAAGMARTADPGMPPPAPVDVIEDPLPEDDISTDQARFLSLLRWKIGHHLFNQLATISYHLIEAAMTSDNVKNKVSGITRLCSTYRATTAAMWYAQASPPRIYTDLIRPSMAVASSSGSGFSGTDNLDFRLMKYRLREFLHRLDKDVGVPDACSDHLWQATCDLYDVQVLDLEHHVLIADKLVGRSPSLKQMRFTTNCGEHLDLSALSGVDTLRGMVAERTHAKARFLTGEPGCWQDESHMGEGNKQW